MPAGVDSAGCCFCFLKKENNFMAVEDEIAIFPMQNGADSTNHFSLCNFEGSCIIGKTVL